MTPRPFVVYWNNIPAPYMVERFNLLATRNRIQFEAWFNERIEIDRSWIVDESTWKFRYRYVPAVTIGEGRFHIPISIIKPKKPDVLVSLYAEPSFFFGLLLSKLRGVKTGIRVVKTFDTWVERTFWKELLKRWLFPRVNFFITEGSDGRAYAELYDAQKNTIFYVRHGIDVKHYRKGSSLGNAERKRIRKELRVKGTTFIYVGRLLKKKGIDDLLDAFGTVQKVSKSEVSLLLVGDGSDETYFRDKCSHNNIHNVIFPGFCQKNNLPKLYGAADVFVFPTLGDPYGLVIDEAMACSLPVISTTAVGEIAERVKDLNNGYLVAPGNSDALAESMLKLVNNSKRITRMGTNSFHKISDHTIKKWVKDFECAVSSVTTQS